MSESRVCTECGLPLPEGAAEGLCPRCLLQAGLGETLTGENPPPITGLGGGKLPDFGSYHPVGVLGEGGMGIVYLAEQREPIRRRVALKVLKRGDDRPSFIARFESERQALALMDHPNIARVYDAGATEDGRLYFAMEYVPGIAITDYCDRNLLGYRERLLLFQQVCQAVQHAHQKGIIHRDLKPSNVLVTLQDGKPVPKVIDFGVAKAVNQRLTERTLFTETGVLLGTPEYMSPEQADLTGLDVDTTTDVYSLGVLLYELLVGALPFDPNALRAAGYAEIQRIIREEDPPRPTTRLSSMGQAGQEVARRRRSDLRTLARLLRGDLEWITMKALDKDRTRRYASASEFATDIGRHLANEPVNASPPSMVYRVGKFVRRHRGKVAALTALTLSVLAGLVASTILYLRANHERAAAEWEGYKASLAAASADAELGRAEDARSRLRNVPKRLRGWEWNYLYWRSDRSVVTLNTGETGPSRIGFSTDGSRLYVSSPSSVHVWNIPGFRRSADYGPFPSIANMSPDGSRVVCGIVGSNKTLEVVETVTGKVLSVLVGHRSPVVDAAFNGNGTRIVTRSEDNEIRVWEVDSSRTVLTIHAAASQRRLPGGTSHELIAFTKDGLRLASTSNKIIQLWDATDGRQIARWESPSGPIQGLTFNDDGTHLLSVEEAVRVWNGSTGESITSLTQAASGGFRSAAENPVGRFMASVTWHQELHLWDRKSGTLMGTTNGIRGNVTGFRYSPNGRYLVAASVRGQVRVWDAGTVAGLVLRVAQSTYTDFDLSKDGQRIAVADGNEVQVLDGRSGEILDSWTHPGTDPVLRVAFNPTGDSVASGSRDGTICLWVSHASVSRTCIQAHSGLISALAFSPDGTQLVSASGSAMVGSQTTDRSIRFWDPVTGKSLRMREFDASVQSIVFSPNGKVLVLCFDPGGRAPIRRLDAATDAELPLEGVSRLQTTVYYPSFGRNGELLAAGLIWDARSGKLLQTLPQASTPAYAFVPDGTRLLGGFNDSTLNFWNPSTGERILRLYLQPAMPMKMSPDGETLYGNNFSSIRIYGTKPAVPPEADELYERLRSRFPLYCDMRDFLRSTEGVDPKLRETVLRMIESAPEDASTVNNLVRKVLLSPGGAPSGYQQALRRSRMIAEDHPWDRFALFCFGVAQYRTGDFQGAIATLERYTQDQERPAPWSALIMAVAHHHLGHFADAKRLLEIARPMAAGANGGADMNALLKELQRDAEALIAPPK